MMPLQPTPEPWTRKHDLPGVPLIPIAPTVHPRTLEDLIDICTNHNPNQRLRGAGSHWALSLAAVSDHLFVETHDPDNMHNAMGKTIYDVVPGCLTAGALDQIKASAVAFDLTDPAENPTPYYVHIETGKRVYQLYAELDGGDDGEPRSLARKMADDYQTKDFLGPWAFKTLGGAGGQTVFGALTTGTHGGDIYFPPIADSVRAIHLVADGGKHYWIEPERLDWLQDKDGNPLGQHRFTDDVKLKRLYGAVKYGGKKNFEIVRDDTMFDAVLMSAGRFGIVYSIVLQAVRQYCLRQDCRHNDWQTVKGLISDTNSELYNADNRFLQIAVNLIPHANGTRNRCGITKRWNAPLQPGPATPPGRDERVGRNQGFDSRLNAPLFDKAGNSPTYSPDPNNPGRPAPLSFLDLACENASFMAGVVDQIYQEVEEFVHNHTAAIGGAVATTAVAGGAAGLAALIPALIAVLAVLLIFLEALRHLGHPRFGQVLDDLRKTLLNQHWGQRNDSTMADIQHRFGDRKSAPMGPLHRWRDALGRVTDNGRLDGFSSAFSRRVGLEIVTPTIDRFTAVRGAGQTIDAVWDCRRNPPATRVRIDVASGTGQVGSQGPLDRTGNLNFRVPRPGLYTLTLVTTIRLNGEERDAMRSLRVRVS